MQAAPTSRKQSLKIKCLYTMVLSNKNYLNANATTHVRQIVGKLKK